jgi:hypothetical protein
VNIILDIREEPLDNALWQRRAEFIAGHRQSGWPRFWQGDEARTRERIAALAQDGVRWFELNSSYSMEGWVLCRTMEHQVHRL